MLPPVVAVVLIVAIVGYFLGRRARAGRRPAAARRELHSLPGYYGSYAALLARRARRWLLLGGLAPARAARSCARSCSRAVPPDMPARAAEISSSFFMSDVRRHRRRHARPAGDDHAGDAGGGRPSTARCGPSAGSPLLVAVRRRWPSLCVSAALRIVRASFARATSSSAAVTVACWSPLDDRDPDHRRHRASRCCSSRSASSSKVPLIEFLFGLQWSPQTAMRADQVGIVRRLRRGAAVRRHAADHA